MLFMNRRVSMITETCIPQAVRARQRAPLEGHPGLSRVRKQAKFRASLLRYFDSGPGKSRAVDWVRPRCSGFGVFCPETQQS